MPKFETVGKSWHQKCLFKISLMKNHKKSAENMEKNIRIELLQNDIRLKHWKSYELNER